MAGPNGIKIQPPLADDNDDDDSKNAEDTDELEVVALPINKKQKTGMKGTVKKEAA